MKHQRGTLAAVGPDGALALAVTRHVDVNGPVVNAPLWWRIKNFVQNRLRDYHRELFVRWIANPLGIVTIQSRLFIKVLKADGRVIDYGLVGTRVVTNNGAGFIVDAFQNLVELENMKFHAFGTGTNAEAAADSALQTELTTEYNPDNTRPTGSTTEASAQVFRSVGTMTIDSGTPAVTEHGLMSQAATGGGVLFDRTKFSAINLVASDSIQATYDLTINSGN